MCIFRNPIARAGELFAILTAIVLTGPVQGVILKELPTRNTSAPTGALEDSGWQFQGRWGNFLGTPITPRHFITAAHVGGSIGGTFTYQGQPYHTTARWTDPDTDLRIWEIDGQFPSFAPLYTANDELGKDLIVFGRGTQRGAEVLVSGAVKGWLWGTDDHVQSWGQNTVSDVDGTTLAFTFDASGGPNEGQLSGGDSGGAVFINDAGTWKLAGINFAVTGRYRLTETSSPFNAALLDQGGLWVETDPNVFQFLPNIPKDLPGASFASRISTRMDWIQSVIPEPSVGLLLAVGCGLAAVRRNRTK